MQELEIVSSLYMQRLESVIFVHASTINIRNDYKLHIKETLNFSII